MSSVPTIPTPIATVVPISSGAQCDPVDTLIDRVVAGDRTAWTLLVDRVHPMVVAAGARWRSCGAVDAQEVRFDVAQRVVDKLHANSFARLRRYCETRQKYPDMTFRHWLSVVTSNAYVDYLRSVPELQRKRIDREVKLVEVQRQPLDESLLSGARIDMATALDIKRVMECIAADTFPPHQRRALALWLVGCDAQEIADELGLADVDESFRLLQAARKRLRRVLQREGMR